MVKIKKSAEILWVLGIFFVALGVSLCSKANLGFSMIAAPALVVYNALSAVGLCFLLALSLILDLTLFSDAELFDWSKIDSFSFHNIGAGNFSHYSY